MERKHNIAVVSMVAIASLQTFFALYVCVLTTPLERHCYRSASLTNQSQGFSFLCHSLVLTASPLVFPCMACMGCA